MANGGLINYLHRKKLAAQQGLPAPAPHSLTAHPIGHLNQPTPIAPSPHSFTENPVPAASPISASLPHATTAPEINALDPALKHGLSPSAAVKLPKLKKMMKLS